MKRVTANRPNFGFFLALPPSPCYKLGQLINSHSGVILDFNTGLEPITLAAAVSPGHPHCATAEFIIAMVGIRYPAAHPGPAMQDGVSPRRLATIPPGGPGGLRRTGLLVAAQTLQRGQAYWGHEDARGPLASVWRSSTVGHAGRLHLFALWLQT